jgi:hypothetical protein
MHGVDVDEPIKIMKFFRESITLSCNVRTETRKTIRFFRRTMIRVGIVIGSGIYFSTEIIAAPIPAACLIRFA